MKRFLSAIGLCFCLLITGLFFLYPATEAQNNVLPTLLNLPAPPPPNLLVERNYRNRAEDFYKKSNPPGDDAPIEDLLDYWQRQSGSYVELGYNIKPSEETLKRILSEIEKDPERLPGFLNILPETSDVTSFVKRLYDREVSEKKYDNEEYSWSEEIKGWLRLHSKYFSDDLLRTAQQVDDTDEYVTNQAELLALARVDWEKARPILDRLINDRSKPVSQVLARWAFYRHALDEDSLGDIEKYRDELKAVVEDKSASPGMRDLAIDALFKEKDWSGRDEWYMTLLGDETLAELKINGQVYTGLTTIMYYAPPEKYADKMLALLKSDNKMVRNAAIRNLARLLAENNEEAVRALLPWLEDKNWAKESASERQLLVAALQSLTIPESVPGLIAVLNEKESSEVSNTMSANSNVAVSSNANMAVYSNADSLPVNYYPFRDGAISALAKQKDARAATALRAILPEVEDWKRGTVVRALLLSNGFSIPEQIEALEVAARNSQSEMMSNSNEANNAVKMAVNSMEAAAIAMNMATMPNLPNSDAAVSGNYSVQAKPYNPNDIKNLLGTQLISNTKPEDELVAALSARISVLDARDPRLATALRAIMQNWRGAAINSLLLKDLRDNKASAESIVKLLSQRKSLREKQPNEVYDLRAGSSLAVGIAACLLEDDGEYNSILANDNAESKTAMLGCARLIRARLPVRKVAEDLKSPNKLLALAAERYLESEDSAEARAIVLSLHPNEAKITGATTYFGADNATVERVNSLGDLFTSVDESLPSELYYYVEESFGDITTTEKKLQKEVKENQELLGVYAYDKNFIRVYKDKAVFSWEEADAARYRARELTGQEFDHFKNYLAAERVDELPPFLASCESECDGKELLMLGRQGGRRVFLMGGRKPKFFVELENIFAEMRRPSAKLYYWLEKSLPGLEILFENENLRARAVWKSGDDLRVLLEDPMRRKQIDKELQTLDENDEIKEDADYEKLEAMRRKRREQREFENFAWYKTAQNQPSGITSQPPQVAFIPERDQLSIQPTNQQWKAKTASFEIREGEDGLYKAAGGKLIKFRDGYYYKPLVTPNGRWAIVSKYSEEAGANVLLRINLLTNKEAKINLEQYPTLEAVAFIPALNKVLILAGFESEYEGENDYETTESYKREALRRGDYFLLDAETGAVQPTKGEIRPLAQQTFRPLQPTMGNADEFWAAIPDEGKNETQVGIYNAKTLSFKMSLKIPQIKFDSMNMWIDSNKIYFVYEGHLLSLPLK